MPCALLPFTFNYVKNVLLEKLSEALSGNAHVNIVVYLHGNADAVTFADTKAARKDYFVLELLF